VVDVACITAFFPETEETLVTPGRTLYPPPPLTTFTVLIGPDAPLDLIAISITDVSAVLTLLSFTVNEFDVITSVTLCLPIIGASSTLSSNIALSVCTNTTLGTFDGSISK